VQIDVLSTDEIFSAKKFCLKQIQMIAFKEEYEALSKGEKISFKSSIRSLNPVWDLRNRLIRVTGRIELSYEDRGIPFKGRAEKSKEDKGKKNKKKNKDFS